MAIPPWFQNTGFPCHNDMNIFEIEDMGEESGREEAADEYPFFPKVSELTSQQTKQLRRWLRYRGKARAQSSLYGLSGRAAKRFSNTWAIGYFANCALFEEHEKKSK